MAQAEYERAMRNHEAPDRYLRFCRNATPVPRGSLSGGSPFEVQFPTECTVAGLRLSTSIFNQFDDTLVFVQPVYRLADGRVEMGPGWGKPTDAVHTVTAREGHAFAGMILSSRWPFRMGIKLVFMRLKEGRLDPDDSYESEWFGSNDGPAWQTRMVSRGKRVLGIYGRAGDAIDALGLRLTDDELPEDEPAQK